MTRTLHILHTNDFHNHLSAGQAAYISRAKARLENVLLIDAGDAISAGNVGIRPGGEPILTLMSETGYDAMTIGNREFHVAETALRYKIGMAQFPVLCANIRWREDRGNALPVVPHFVKQMENGLRVGIFGLTIPMVTERMAARLVSAFVFDDPIESARRQIENLRSQVDVLVALTHIGLREDERLARSCPELNLIVGGHSHVVLTAPEVVENVSIVQGGWYGHYLGHVKIQVGSDSIVSVSAHLETLPEQPQS